MAYSQGLGMGLGGLMDACWMIFVWSVEDQGLGLRLAHVEGFRGWDFRVGAAWRPESPKALSVGLLMFGV